MTPFDDQGPTPKAPAADRTDEIVRFQACERHLHWAIAIPFKICYLTALILITVYNPAPERPFRDVFAWIHRLSGICLALAPPLTIFIHRREFGMHLGNIREAWSWRFDDLKWLLLMAPATLSKRVTLPHQGKFNAAEKINFIVVMSTYPLYIATGLTIWFLKPAFLAWMIHFAMAILATPLVLGHIFMATVNPDTRVGLKGMITGRVSRDWARHHYHRWYEEHFGRRERATRAETTVRPTVPTATVPVAAVPTATVPTAAVTSRPPVAARPVVSRGPVEGQPTAPRPPVPAAASGTRPAAARPAVVLWPPEAQGADPSFAS